MQAHKDYQELKNKHKEARQTFIEQLAQDLEDAGFGTKASQLRQLKQREDIRFMFRRIKRLKGDNNLTTTFIKVKENGQTRDVTDRTNMEEHIIASNQDKYHQSEDSCPFLHEPLLSDFGYHGEGTSFDAFCRGEYSIPNSIDSITK